MAVVVVDKDNYLDEAQGKEIASTAPDTVDKVTERRRGAPTEAKEAPKEQKATQVENESDLDDEDFAALTEKQQRTVNKKHRAMKEADEFAEEQYRERRAAERRAEQAEERLKALEEKGKPAPVEVKEPDPKDFTNEKGEFDAFGYAKALAKHAAEEAVKADRKEQTEAATKAAEAKRYQEYMGRVNEDAKDIPDWEEVKAEADENMKVSGALTGYLQERSKIPAKLLTHFVRNPDELERLNALSPILAIAEITELELSLKKSTAEVVQDPVKASKTTKTRAPEPIAPLTNGGGVVPKDPRDMTTREHIEDEYKQAREAHYARKRH